MRRLVFVLILALGVSTTVGGIIALLYSYLHAQSTFVVIGPYRATWEPENYCFFGAILASVGAGLVTFGLLARRE
jgi:hypothetical protein